MEIMFCRHCNVVNPWVYFAPQPGNGIDGDRWKHSSCICNDCVESKGWVDPKTGNLIEGVEL